MKKQLQRLLLLAALLLPWVTQAQLGDYTFTTGTDATKWITLTSTVNRITGTGDSKASSLLDIGFVFPFGWGEYTQFSVNSDGNLRLGSTVTGTANYATPFSSSNAIVNNPKINGMGCDGFITDSGYVYSQNTVDNMGDSLLVVEFATSTFNATSRPSLLKWQVHLYPDGRVEIVYSSRAPAILPNVTRQCGLCYNANSGWTVNASHAATHFTNGTSTTIATGTWPDANRYYSFSPAVSSCSRPSHITAVSAPRSITLTWNGTASEYEVQYGRAGYTPVEGVGQSVYDTTVQLTGLTMGTTYDCYVRAICGSDTSTWSFGTFVTSCDSLRQEDLPYAEDFEAYGTGSASPISPCWHKGVVAITGSGTTTDYPYPYSTAAINGTRGLYFYAATTSSTAYYNWMVLPSIDASMNMSDLMVEFKLKRTSTSSYQTRLVVGVTTDYTTTAGFVPVDTIDLSSAATSSVHDVEVSFANYTGAGTYVLFYAPAPTTTATNAFYVDDIILRRIPTCFRPTAARMVDVASDEATLEWNPDSRTATPASGYQVEYGLHGFQRGMGTFEYPSDTTVTLYNLTPSTEYDAYISADCGNELSDSRLVTFRTTCAPIATDSLPYNENFDSYPATTAVAGGQTMNPCWHKGTNYTSAYPYLRTTVSSSSPNSMYFYATAAYYSYVALPAFEAGIDQLVFEFEIHKTSASYGHVRVGVMSNPDDISTFTTLGHAWPTANNAWERFSFEFPNYSGNGRYLAILLPDSITSYVSLDNVSVSLRASCPTPQTTAVTQIASDSVTLVWSNDSLATSWDVYYGFPGFALDTTPYQTVNDTTITLHNLQPNTEYEYVIVASCNGDPANPTFPASFRTACTPIPVSSLPYVENFDSYPSGTAVADGQTLNSCWRKGTNYTSDYPYVYNSYAASSPNSLRFYTTTTYYCYAVLPMFDTAITALQVRFDLVRYSTSYTGKLTVGVMSDPRNIATFTPIRTCYPNVQVNQYASFEVPLDSYTGMGRYIAFKANSDSNNYAHLDNVVVELIPACRRSENLVSTGVTAHEASLSWSNNSLTAPTGYQVAYSMQERFNTDTCHNLVSATDTHATLTSLQAYSTYYWAVRALCGSDTGRWSALGTFTTEVDCGANGINIVDTIGRATTSNYSYTMYCYSSYPTGYSRSIFTVEELADMGIQQNNVLNGISLHSGSVAGTIQNVSIYLMETDLNEFSNSPAGDTVAPANMTRVFHGNLTIPANSWVNIPFDTVFPFSGSRNILVTLARNGSASGSIAFYYTTTTPAYRACYGYRSSSTTTNNTCSRTYLRTNMVFNICSEVPQCERPSDVALATLLHNSATVTWSGDAPRYEVAYGAAGFNPDTVASLAGTHAVVNNDSTYTLTGLTPQTGYDVYVRTLCASGDTSVWSIVLSFTTPCAPQALPFTENFESYASGSSVQLNGCWRKGTNNSTAYPYPYSTNAVSGVRSLYFYAYNSSSTQYYCYAALPLMSAPVDTLMLSFKMRRYATTTAAYTTRMVVGVMTDPTDITTFEPVDTIDLRDEDASSIHSIDVMFNNYHGTGSYIALYDEVPPLYGTSTSCYSYAYVDDIVVDYMPSCLPVTNVTVADSTVGATTAVVNWTDRAVPAAGYELEYGPQGFTHGNGTVVPSLTRPATLTGLVSGTNYDVYVRALCSTDNPSPWSPVVHFTTVCTPKTLPYTEDFEAYGSGAAFAIDPCWTKGTTSSTAYPYPNSSNAITGTRSLYFYAINGSSSYYSYAALPEMDAPIDSLIMTFKMRRYNSTTAYYTSRIVVGVMTDPARIATFTPMDTIDLHDEAVNSIHSLEVSFAGYHGTGRHIAFYDAVPPRYGTESSTYSYVYLDDIFVDRIPNCMSPVDVTVPDSTITATSAEVRWTDRSTASLGYEIEYGPAGFVHGRGTVVTATTQPVTLTGLTPATDYEVYVRSFCSATDTSAWSFSAAFTTLCQPLASLPVTYDFEGWPTGTTAQLPNCWIRLNNGTSYGYFPYVNNGTANSHGGTNHLYWYMPTTTVTYGDYAVMVLPEVDTAVYAANTWEMSFWGKGSATATNDHKIMVGVITDPANPASFVGVDTITLTSNYAEYRVSFANYTGRGTYPAFRKNRGTAAGYAYVDDIILMQASACPRPYNLQVTASTATTATLAWQDTIGATTWEVAYHATGDTVDQVVTATANPFILTGLTPSTTYTFRVAAHCPNGTQTGDYSIETARFTTSQVPDTVPVFYNFENASEWASWQTVSNNAVNWYRGTVPFGDANRHAIYISADSGATRSTNMNAIVNACAYRDIDFGDDTGSFAVSFRVNVGGTRDHSYDGLSVLLVDPNTVVTPTATGLVSPWGHLNSISLSVTRRTNGWATTTVYFDRVSGVKRMVLYWFNQSTGAADFIGEPPAVDSVYVYAQACPRPSGLVAEPTSITSTSAMVRWNGPATGTDYIVTHRVAGAAVSTNIVDTVHTNYTLLTGLTGNTNYYYWVRRICDSSHTSAYSATGSFTTLCGLYAAHDTLRENFDQVTAVAYNAEGGQLPDCWEGYSNGTDSKFIPHVTGGGTYSYSISGTRAITMTSGSSADKGNTKIVRLPRFVEPVSSLTLSYWMCTEGSSQGTLAVGYMTGYNYETDFVPVKSIAASSATQHSGDGLQTNRGVFDTVTFDSVPANAIYIAFRWYHNATFYSCCIDNIEVTSNITCAAPTIAGTPHDYESITLMWAGSAMDYDVAITNGAWSTDIVPVATHLTGNSYRFAGLQPATNYTVGVRQHCDSANTSLWNTVTVMTDSLPCLAPDSLTVSNITNTNATFNWTARGTETAWDIHVYNTTVDTAYTVTTNPATVSGLTAGVTYYAAVRALCGNAQNIEGEWSDSIQFSTLVCPNVTGLATGNVTFNSVTLTWDTAVNAQGYEVEYGQTGFTQGNGTRLTATTNTLTVSGLLDETQYDFYVRAVCGTDWTSENWGNPVTATTLSAPHVTYNITAAVSPTNAGTVTGDGVYGQGDTAILTATANTGYTFTRWNDNVTANPRSVRVTSDSAFTAFFTLNQYTVTVLSADSSRGTVTGGGSYNHGDVATLTATPATGYHFTQWNDGDTNAVRTITVTSDTTFTASFGVNSYNVTVTANDNTMGTVTGGGQYNFRDTVTLTATANTGYYFQRWDDGNVDNPRVIVVTGDVSLTAIFASDSVPPVQTYTVTLTANDANMGIVSGAGTYTEGTSVLISATPNAGYRFVNWNDGVTDNPRTFVLTCDTAFTANFAELVDSTAVLVVTFDSEMGYVLINGNEAGTYNGLLGDEVSLEARANEGYRFVEWSDGETSATRTITLEQSRTTLTATFAVGSNGIATVEDNVNCLIYPNPASSSTTISVSGVNGKVCIAVIDINGRVAASETMECAGDCVKTMNVDNLSQGAYFVRITGEKVNMVKKLIVR